MNKLRFSQGACFLFIAIGIALVLAYLLPESAGNENGPIECSQLIILTLGIPFSLYTAFRAHTSPDQKKLLLLSVPVWLTLIGRELSWGRVFYPIAKNEFVSLNFFRYGPYLHKGLAFSAICLSYALYKAGICRELRQLGRNYRRLACDFSIITIAIILTTLFDKHVLLYLNNKAMLYEELSETIVYLSLLAIIYDRFHDPDIICTE